jgi:hypothetical protein
VLWLLFDGFVLTCPIGGASTPPFISRGGGRARLQGRLLSWLQHDPNQDSISTYLFYIYFYRYNYLSLGEHSMVL